MIKKNVKVVLVFILGVFCAVGITFAYSVSSKNILINKTGWNVSNVEEALKYLHSASCPALAKFTITYDLNGGTGCSNRTYKSSDANFNLCTPTKTDYTFTGWTGSNGSTPQTTVTITTGTEGNKEYTANWVKTPKIGTSVTIGGEKFRIIGVEGNYTKLFAKYCLDANGNQTSSNYKTIKFAETMYYYGKIGEGKEYNDVDLLSYNYYVYDSNSNLSSYMTNYANKIKQAGNYSTVSARPVRLDEFWQKNYWTESGSCDSFWAGDAIWGYGSGYDGKGQTCNSNNWDCWGTAIDSSSGIKPVVLVPTSEIE